MFEPLKNALEAAKKLQLAVLALSAAVLVLATRESKSARYLRAHIEARKLDSMLITPIAVVPRAMLQDITVAALRRDEQLADPPAAAIAGVPLITRGDAALEEPFAFTWTAPDRTATVEQVLAFFRSDSNVTQYKPARAQWQNWTPLRAECSNLVSISPPHTLCDGLVWTVGVEDDSLKGLGTIYVYQEAPAYRMLGTIAASASKLGARRERELFWLAVGLGQPGETSIAPGLLRVWPDVKDLSPLTASLVMEERGREGAQQLDMLGVNVDESTAALAAPLLMFGLLVFLALHLRQAVQFLREAPEDRASHFPWPLLIRSEKVVVMRWVLLVILPAMSVFGLQFGALQSLQQRLSRSEINVAYFVFVAIVVDVLLIVWMGSRCCALLARLASGVRAKQRGAPLPPGAQQA